MVARLEAAPASKFALLGISPNNAWDRDVYNKVEKAHAAYLKELKSINLKELTKRQKDWKAAPNTVATNYKYLLEKKLCNRMYLLQASA